MAAIDHSSRSLFFATADTKNKKKGLSQAITWTISNFFCPFEVGIRGPFELE